MDSGRRHFGACRRRQHPFCREAPRADHRLRLAQDEVEHLAKVAERERIARDLHDLLGHTLSLIVLKSELAAKLSESDPARGRRRKSVTSSAFRARRSARCAAPCRAIAHLTLEESLARARQALSAAGIEIEADVAPVRMDPQDRKRDRRSSLREAVTNVIRHARASRCRRAAARGTAAYLPGSETMVSGGGRRRARAWPACTRGCEEFGGALRARRRDGDDASDHRSAAPAGRAPGGRRCHETP